MSFLDDDGDKVAPAVVVTVPDTAVTIPLPRVAWDYLVVRVQAIREGGAAPRAMEVHLARTAAGIHLNGVTH